MTRWLALDTETSGLDPSRGAVPWEVGIVTDDGTEHLWRWRLSPDDEAAADPEALSKGGYNDRAPLDMHWTDAVRAQQAAAREIAGLLTDDVVLVGVNVGFDVAMLRPWLFRFGLDPWGDAGGPHYRPISIDSVAVGYLIGQRTAYEHWNDVDPGVPDLAATSVDGLELPWKSDTVGELLGVAAAGNDRHTALGDARWAYRLTTAVGLAWLPSPVVTA